MQLLHESDKPIGISRFRYRGENKARERRFKAGLETEQSSIVVGVPHHKPMIKPAKSEIKYGIDLLQVMW